MQNSKLTFKVIKDLVYSRAIQLTVMLSSNILSANISQFK